MLKQGRQNKILDLIRRQQQVRVADLSQTLQVSGETIRRDLHALEAQGFLECIHGGAVLKMQTARELSVRLRFGTHAAEKISICQYAASLVQDGDSLAIGGSTTTAALGSLLQRKNNLTVITNSIGLALSIGENPTNTIILSGGEFNFEEKKSIGTLSAQTLRQFHADKAFFSAAGITVEAGVTDYSESESDITRSILDISNRAFLLNDYSKFNVVALRKICDASAISAVITDGKASRQKLRELNQIGIEAFVAGEK